MDNRLKRDLVKFFKKMNKNNVALFKEDKSKIKDIENIEDDETLIQEGLKQCQFVLNHFSEKFDNQEEKENKEKLEREKREKEEKERIEREKKERERLEKERKEKEETERKEREKKELEEKKKKELEEKQKKELEEKKQKELKDKEVEKENEKELPKENINETKKELTGLQAIQEKTKQKEQKEKANQISKSINSPPIEKKSSKKLQTLKRLPTLSELTDEQFGTTEKSIYEIGDGIKVKVEWKYLRDKTYIPKEDEEDPEKHEKVDLIFTTNYIDPLILHWGVFRAFHESEWIHPEKECYPEFSKEFDKKAIQTEFTQDESEDWPSIRIMLKRGIGFENVIGGINFVIYDPVKNRWFNNYRKDFQIKFKLKINKKKSKMILIDKHLSVPEFVSDIITCEASYGSWTLMHRYNKCCDIINSWDENTPNEYWYWILIWLRYSYQRQLDWQRNYNTRPALLSGAMSNLSDILTRKYSEFIKSENNYRNLIQCKSFIIKNILSLLGKGTGNGQEIRDEILKIMRRNKMSKKPEKNFYEQWHQKLHNNTTPDDIVICEAVINFLKSKGDKNVYWKTLKEGGVSKERLASYERNITDEPFYSPDYNIQDFENYLKILKSVHASTDLLMTYEGCKNYIGNNAIEKMEDILKNKDTTEIIPHLNKVAELREELSKIINNLISQSDNMKLREVLFLEISLE